MKTLEELKPQYEALYAKLGGIGNPDARLVRALFERAEKAEKLNESLTAYATRMDTMVDDIFEAIKKAGKS